MGYFSSFKFHIYLLSNANEIKQEKPRKSALSQQLSRHQMTRVGKRITKCEQKTKSSGKLKAGLHFRRK